MKIAVPYENGRIFQHFGRTETFKIYDVEGNTVTSSEIISTNGSGHGALAGILTTNQVHTLICGGIGAGAQTALAEAGIRVYGGADGNADDAINALLSGTLRYNPDVQCNHHAHGDHPCGDHGCGTHGCQH